MTHFADCERFVAQALARVEGQPRIVLISVPAPFAPVEAFLRTRLRAPRFFWDSPGDRAFAGEGAVRTLTVSGSEPFAALKAELKQLWAEVLVCAHPAAKPLPPRLFGGMAFRPGSESALWSEFGGGSFTLSRWTYGRRTERAFLTLAVRGDVDCTPERRRELLSDLDGILRGLRDAEDHSAIHGGPRHGGARTKANLRQVDFPSWERHLGKIQAAIGGGSFKKIVAARRCDVDLPGHPDELEVLSRLVAEATCTRFLFGRDTYSFLGASPETLFDKRGKVVRTQALAGTSRCRPGEDAKERGEELLQSAKDLSEHSFVVDEIARALGSLCEQLHFTGPRVRQIREILHLETPFKGQLKDTVHPVDLLAALHPTPAVGGLPTAAAADWISANEEEDRGWYTGPVGWMDAVGDARFVVAIRCGLVGPRKAHIFTGAGIVSASQAYAEYAETSLKQGPLLRALGIAGTGEIEPPMHSGVALADGAADWIQKLG